MKNLTATAMLGIAVLSACHSEPQVDVKNASVAEVANKVADATAKDDFMIRPGKWQSTVTIEDVKAPGMPTEMAARMKGMMGSGQSHETCLTEAEAKRPNEDFFAGKNDQCRYDHFKMGDGKIDAKMTCAQQGVSQVMEMAGDYSPDNYRMTMQTHTEGGGPAGGMTMKMRVDSRRVGECTAKTS